MKYINQIDDLIATGMRVSDGNGSKMYIARPHQGYGLLKWQIRIHMAWACLTGKADAVTFYKQ